MEDQDKALEQKVNDPKKLKIIVELNVLFKFSKELFKKLRFPLKLHQNLYIKFIFNLLTILLVFNFFGKFNFFLVRTSW